MIKLIKIIGLNLLYLFYRVFSFIDYFEYKLEMICIWYNRVFEIEYFYMKYIKVDEFKDDIEFFESGIWWEENKDKMKWYNKLFGYGDNL